MTTSNADIQRLIDRFMSGQTSLDEEARLAAYFRTHDVPDEWAGYKALFAYFDAGMPATYGSAVGGKVAATVAMVPWWRKAMRWAAAAAVVAAVAAAALHLDLAGSDNAGSPQRATVAQAVTAKQEASATPVPAVSEAEPHIAQAVNTVKVKAKSAHGHRQQPHEVVPTADGVAEYSAMVVAAEYDQWMSRLESDMRTQQAMALMEQGAAVAVMCSDSGNVPEVP